MLTHAPWLRGKRTEIKRKGMTRGELDNRKIEVLGGFSIKCLRLVISVLTRIRAYYAG